MCIYIYVYINVHIYVYIYISYTFLYIALIDMFPQLMKLTGWRHVLVQTLGMVVGMGAMLLLGYFEDEDECL